MSDDLLLSCTNQRRQRSRFFYHEAGDPSSRFTIDSPYEYDSNDQLVYTPGDLDMRRKCEILKYKEKSMGSESNSQANFYSYLARRRRNNNLQTASCNIAKPTSSSDVPGKIILLKENPNVPLYKYYDITRQFQFQNIPYDDYKRDFDIFPVENIEVANLTSVNFLDLIVLNPPNVNYVFNVTIPISIRYEANFIKNIEGINNINSAVLSIFSATFYNYYSDSLVTTIDVPFRTANGNTTNDIVETTQVLLMNLSDSTNGTVSCTQYIGNININNIPITAVTQYVYSFFLQLSTSYSEYSTNTQAERANTNGSSITSSGETNLTNVSYSFITNFDNINSDFYSSSENCVISLYNDTAEIEANSIPYTEFSITSSVSG